LFADVSPTNYNLLYSLNKLLFLAASWNILYHYTLKDSEKFYLHFMWIMDELHLADCGVKGKAQSYRDTMAVLQKIADINNRRSKSPAGPGC